MSEKKRKIDIPAPGSKNKYIQTSCGLWKKHMPRDELPKHFKTVMTEKDDWCVQYRQIKLNIYFFSNSKRNRKIIGN